MRKSLVVIGLLLLGCDSGDAGAGVTPASGNYSDISGTFAGPVINTPETIPPISATLSLTIMQDGGSFTGTYALAGTLVGKTGTLSGPFTGTEASGDNPSIKVTFADTCLGFYDVYSGSYDSTNRILTLTGPLYVPNADCTHSAIYMIPLVLSR